jgi:hypothetical protein
LPRHRSRVRSPDADNGEGGSSALSRSEAIDNKSTIA